MTSERHKEEHPLRGRGRQYYSQFRSGKTDPSPANAADQPTKAQLHRQLSETASRLKINAKLSKIKEDKQIEAVDIIKIFDLKDELGNDGSDFVKKIAQREIAPRHVPDSVSDIARMIYDMTNPRSEPVTTHIKTRPLGFFPFGGTEIIHTDYHIDNEFPQRSEADPIKIERKTFWDRLFRRR
jgi:hypothetical protein